MSILEKLGLTPQLVSAMTAPMRADGAVELAPVCDSGTYYARHRAQVKAQQRAYYLRHRAEKIARQRERRAAGKLKRK